MSRICELTLFGLVTSLVQADDCPYKECSCTATNILCDYLDLKVMPQKLFNNISTFTTLLLDGNHITTIPAGSLLANLSGISLQGNPTENIDSTAFDESIYTLQELSFSQAQFTQIPQAVFHLKALKSLLIYQTNILVWNDNGMNQLGAKLQSLSLTAVGFTSWPTWMKSMTNLKELIITGSSISDIPDDGLDVMTNTLTSLDLSNNGLIKLPKSMSKLTVLSTLTLNYNRIINVALLPQSNNLSALYLDNNKITDAQALSTVLRLCAHTLASFTIQNNSLTSIPELSFLTQISYLNFQFNHIIDANSGSFPANITNLNFGNNLLFSIPSNINNLNIVNQLYLYSNNIHNVQGTQIPTSVEMLDLSSNSISQLTRTSFPGNSSLYMLFLSNNPLSTISPDAFSNIPLLTQLNLQSTKLTRLPLAVASLTKLTQLDVSNSPSLVCTCQEQSLRTLIVPLGYYSVIGNCGMSTVNFFFETLSSECPQIS